ncbi:hypothetical protein HZF24_04500 [Sedimentibacter hydroxybenzoicus DSM 7310]|uniref:Uncharacterized protein n=1 Tax=Sedimentibacter hydroxybenzoicus DSM 7310 TaxID=1123245 RepID=A0A974BI91_SEDHY|nr:hypothetical protein [Sedimentibacter hydroxybenzoicus]NYB73396.1 hypothetical protein [Sedimentibacter hydroxybenzoicus DSM 7310]
MTNAKFRDIINQYRNIIAEDGEVEENELKEWLELDEDLPEEHKTPEGMNKLIKEILGPKKKPERKPYKKLGKEEAAERMALYNQGLTDREIAKIQGVKCSIICSWRNNNNLKFNEKINSEMIALYSQRMILYNQGFADKEIAEVEGLTADGIRGWRRRNNLKPNKKPRRIK